MKNHAYLLTIFIFIASMQCSISYAITARSTFDTGVDGWTCIGSGSFGYVDEGGNPGGFVRFVDISGTSGDGWIIAPTKFLGDWTTLDGNGVLSWDHIILQEGGVDTILQGQVMIAGPEGTATCTTLESMKEFWKSFSVPVSQPAWKLTLGSWAGLINNVTELKIRIEAVWNVSSPLDIDGIDNVVLTEERTLKADLNHDGIVDFHDFAIMAEEWLETESWYLQND
jgi:hypothetical protein